MAPTTMTTPVSTVHTITRTERVGSTSDRRRERSSKTRKGVRVPAMSPSLTRTEADDSIVVVVVIVIGFGSIQDPL
jgi:hypothetical protein